MRNVGELVQNLCQPGRFHDASCRRNSGTIHSGCASLTIAMRDLLRRECMCRCIKVSRTRRRSAPIRKDKLRHAESPVPAPMKALMCRCRALRWAVDNSFSRRSSVRQTWGLFGDRLSWASAIARNGRRLRRGGCGKPDCSVRCGAGNGVIEKRVRHRQPKGGTETDTPTPRCRSARN